MGRIAYDDVRTLTASRIAADCGRLPSVIVGSPPCQDASVANTTGRGVDGERTGLFFDAIRLVGECRPVWACFENVPGLRTRGSDRVLAELEALGYTCWPLVVGAWHAGAPHIRKRVWIIAADAARGTGAAGASWVRPHSAPGQAGSGPSINHPLPDATSWGPRSRPDVAQSEPSGVLGHADCERLEIRQGEREDALAELPPAIRAIAEGSGWNGGAGGLARSRRMVDGLSAGVVRQCISAYGDAVLPQITEAIGRVMMRLLPTDGTVLDLFSGAAGGWSLGLHRAGYRTIAFCEIDDWRRAMFGFGCQV